MNNKDVSEAGITFDGSTGGSGYRSKDGSSRSGVLVHTADITAPPGPLSDLAIKASVDPLGKKTTMTRWIAEIFGFVAPGEKVPNVNLVGVTWTDENGRFRVRGLQVCFDCGWAMIFSDGARPKESAPFARIYLTYPDGKLRKVYDRTKGSPSVEVTNISDDVKAGFEEQVDYWKKQLNAK